MEMDPERVRAYLQVACAGLGFEIGEVWWTSNENGQSTVAEIEQPNNNVAEDGTLVNANTNNNVAPPRPKRKQFVQLYTSKAYESRRSELVNPSPPESDADAAHHIRYDSDSTDLNKHVLSPRLVDAIVQTTQVVWANSQSQEGLLGRSDMPLQTAVGMPVAMDDEGNVCVVVMFSSNNVQSTDDAMEYLQSISQSATSTNIPCLMPVLDPRSNMRGMQQLTHDIHAHHNIHPSSNVLGEGIAARFVSLDDQHPSDHSLHSSSAEQQQKQPPPELPLHHQDHDLANAPKDTFGIPMLPTFAELGNVTPDDNVDIFDDFSYGIWTTIMENPDNLNGDAETNNLFHFDLQQDLITGSATPLIEGSTTADAVATGADATAAKVSSDPERMQVALSEKKASMSEERKTRLEEFCSAFLDMSVFDLADVWVPTAGDGDHYPDDCLRHVTSVSSVEHPNALLDEFRSASVDTLVKFWTGAVGRAYSSGNPVWSANPDIFVDPGRAAAFDSCKIRTVLAVPVFSGKQVLPACVVSCYSLVRSGSVPFVLKFVQQALRLLWEGLDKVQPHQSVESNWRAVAPADLGEMAADLEMQQHFMTRKRPRGESFAVAAAAAAAPPPDNDPQTTELASQFQTIRLPSGETVTIPMQLSDTAVNDQPPQQQPQPTFNAAELQQHVYEAVRSVANAVPFDDYAATSTTTSNNTPADGPNRVHKMAPPRTLLPTGHPLPMPHSFPTTIVGSASSRSPPLKRFHRQPTGTTPPKTTLTMLHTGPALGLQPPNTDLYASPPSSIPRQQQPQQPPQGVYMGVPGSAGAHHQNTYAPPAPPVYSNPSAVGSPPAAAAAADTLPTAGISHPYFVRPPASADNFLEPAIVTSTSAAICRIHGCNDPVVARRLYCAQHSGNRLCEREGCTKCAQGSTRFCIAHGGGRRCTFPGCDKGARDKFFCAAHGGGKRCTHEGCSKSAVGGSSLCTGHGGGRRCSVEGCDKSAQSSTKFCVKHGGGKKCAHEGCEKVARGRTLYCAAHGGGIRCKLEGCNRVAIGKFQLCRAHGGGSSRAKEPRPTTLSPFLQPPGAPPQQQSRPVFP